MEELNEQVVRNDEYIIRVQEDGHVNALILKTPADPGLRADLCNRVCVDIQNLHDVDQAEKDIVSQEIMDMLKEATTGDVFVCICGCRHGWGGNVQFALRHIHLPPEKAWICPACHQEHHVGANTYRVETA